MDTEELLFQQKQKKNKEDPRKNKGDEGELVSLADVKIYKVSFPFNNGFIVAGYMFSAHQPIEEDFLDLVPMTELKGRADELKSEGVIKSIDDLWNAYNDCRINPSLIQYVPLSREESKMLLWEGVEPM